MSKGWNDKLVIKFAIQWLNKRVKWAIMHDYAAAPSPIQLELKDFKMEYDIEDKEPTALTNEDDFKWTNELIAEYYWYKKDWVGKDSYTGDSMKDFKRSKLSQSIPAGEGTANETINETKQKCLRCGRELTGVPTIDLNS